MRLLLVASILALAGCAQTRTHVPLSEQPQLLAAPRAVYSAVELQAIQKAMTLYIKENGAQLSQYRPVVVQGTVLKAGTLEGQSYRPGTAMLRQLGYLPFDAPDVQAWIDPAPSGCIRGRCTFVGHLEMSQGKYDIPVDY